MLREEVLDPQFRYEAEHLLPRYVEIERVLAAEYLRLGLITAREAEDLGAALASVDAHTIDSWREQNMSDIAFALERYVEQRLPSPIPVWHVDRSRNDLQSCAQLLFGRDELAATADALLRFGVAAHRRAGESADLPMPGYTHFQAAQIITPGFYLAALSEQALHTARRMLATYDGIDACPLGAGAMAGQELAWDRAEMARLLGFRRVQPLALTSVASRGWVAEVTAELGLLGGALSRFCTDLLTWAGSEHGFVDLPDALSGISSAMPQKKNFPVLERIRGRTAHLAAYHLDVLLGQRNTPYTNLVEVSKEAGANLLNAFTTGRSVLRLFTAVLDGLAFRADRMARACEQEYFGGFSLANALTLDEGVPWRRAQVIAGAYILAAIEAGRTPRQIDAELLRTIAGDHGFELAEPERALAEAFDVDRALARMSSSGSARPDAVRAVLDEQEQEYRRLREEWSARATARHEGPKAVDRLLRSHPAV
ncbi:argininosuccinate lyase [Solihabitans fulvus]|uniref:argininosuccinate lyase n=1 Tax=Solihabitans fulvus TaxID=1892852 RepID=A0A5B2WSH5_9PSEU|nr:argininosuccinate lyase [Solihabitans fulvus]